MLTVSLRGINFEFWSCLGCSAQSANILSWHHLRYRLGFCEETQNYAKMKISQIFFFLLFFKQSRLGVKICLRHAHIGLL